MIYNNLREIRESIEAVRGEIYAFTEPLSPEQAAFRRSPESWSVAELLEHICKTEEFLGVRISALVDQAEVSQGRAPAGFTPGRISIEEAAKQAEGKRFVSPESVRPTAVPLAESLDRLRASRARLLADWPRFEALDLTGVAFPHPVFGPLNIYQWLAFFTVHEDRHLEQMRAVISAEGFPGRRDEG